MDFIMESILFSIMVPVYNTEKYIEACINSVINQTYSNWELIIVDDGSTDNSGTICDSFSLIDSRIKTFHKQHEGLFVARVFGRNQAKGEYHVYLDSDDLLKPDALKTINDAIQRANSECIIYEFKYSDNSIYLRNKKVSNYSKDYITYSESDKRELYKRVFVHPNYNNIWRKAVRSDILKDIDYSDYYNIQYGEDLVQSIDIYKRCKNITFIPDILYVYTFNPQSMMNTKQMMFDAYADYTIDQMVLNFLKKENVFTKQDYFEYRKYNLWTLDCMIRDAITSHLPESNKRRFFDKIRKNAYYNDFLLGKDMEYITCTLLRDHKDNILINYGKVRRKARQLILHR